MEFEIPRRAFAWDHRSMLAQIHPSDIANSSDDPNDYLTLALSTIGGWMHAPRCVGVLPTFCSREIVMCNTSSSFTSSYNMGVYYCTNVSLLQTKRMHFIQRTYRMAIIAMMIGPATIMLHEERKARKLVRSECRTVWGEAFVPFRIFSEQ